MVVITIAMLKPELKSLLANCFLSSPPAFQPLMQIFIHCPVNLLIENPIFFFYFKYYLLPSLVWTASTQRMMFFPVLILYV